MTTLSATFVQLPGRPKVELSSRRNPVASTDQRINALVPDRVSVNPGTCMMPGEPISAAEFTATKAPLTLTALNWVMFALFNPPPLSKVANGPTGDAPNETLACNTLLLL